MANQLHVGFWIALIALAPIESHAGILGDFLKRVFPSLSSNSAPTEEPRENPLENYQPGPPPSEEELGNRNELSEALPENSVMVDKFNVCRIVSNSRGDIHSVMIPHLIEQEWSSFVANPPPGVTLSDCLCGRNLSPEEIYARVGNVREIYRPLPPLPGIPPRMSSRPTTLNYLCEQMQCGPPEWIAYRTYSSPDNNAIVRWTGAAWQKVPATVENEKIDGCAGTGERMLRCKPLGQPAGPIQRRNCDE